MGRHDKLVDVLVYLAVLVTSSNRVCNEPKLAIGCNTTRAGVPSFANTDSSRANPPRKDFEREDILSHGLYNFITSCIIDKQLINADQPAYLSFTLTKTIKSQKNTKKEQYLDSCLE